MSKELDNCLTTDNVVIVYDILNEQFRIKYMDEKGEKFTIKHPYSRKDALYYFEGVVEKLRKYEGENVCQADV